MKHNATRTHILRIISVFCFFSSYNLRHDQMPCLLCVLLVTQEPTQPHPPQKTGAAEASPSVSEKEPKSPSSGSPHRPSLALLRLLQTAFKQQATASQRPGATVRPLSARRKQQSRGFLPLPTKLPAHKLYQALDLINKFSGPGDSLYSDYSDGFYNIKPYKHRNDRLLQALFEMLDDE